MSSFLTPPDPEEDPRDDAQRWEDRWKAMIAERNQEIALLLEQLAQLRDGMESASLATSFWQGVANNYLANSNTRIASFDTEE